MKFPKESAFGREEERQTRRERIERFEQRLFELDPPKEVGITAKLAKHDPPLEHWNHDLTTVDILLEQSPPDIERARGLLWDVGNEIQSYMKG